MIDFGSIWDRMTGGASLTSSRRTAEEVENRPSRGATAPRCSFGGIVPDDAASFAGEAIFPSRGPVSADGLSWRDHGGPRATIGGRTIGQRAGDYRVGAPIGALRPDPAPHAAKSVSTLDLDPFLIGEDDTLGDAPVARDELRVTDEPLKATIDELQGVVGRQAAELERLRPILRPLRIGELIEKRNATECGVLDDPAEEVEVALWAEDQRGRAIRFVAELATMTDIEAEFLDGSELRQIARLLQIPGEDAPTMPRLYSDEDRKRASSALQAAEYRTGVKFEEMVDAVAEALGMRRAGA